MKILTTALLITASSISYSNQTNINTCGANASLAGKIMELRQDQFDLFEVHKAMSGDNKTINLVNRAYEKPAYQMQENKLREIQRFKNQIMLECMQQLNSQ